MIDSKYFWIVFGMGLATYIPRWFPLLFLSRRKLPRWFVDWLDLIPAAILSALLMPALVTSGASRQLVLLQPEFLAAVPTFVFALKTKSLGATVLAGMMLFWLAGQVL